MLAAFEAFFNHWFGSPYAAGAASWLQVFTWLATPIAAIIAVIALRKNTVQNRATLLLNLHRTWEGLADQRYASSEFFNETRDEAMHMHPGNEKKQIRFMRRRFSDRLHILRDGGEADVAVFTQLVAYISFFEIVGMYVRNRYIPLRDIIQAYKGPILGVDIVWRDFIKAWEEEAHVPEGLFEHALFLMDVTKAKTGHPIRYWIFYRFYIRLWGT